MSTIDGLVHVKVVQTGKFLVIRSQTELDVCAAQSESVPESSKLVRTDQVKKSNGNNNNENSNSSHPSNTNTEQQQNQQQQTKPELK